MADGIAKFLEDTYGTGDVLNQALPRDPLTDPRGYIGDYLRKQGRTPSPEMAKMLAERYAPPQPNMISRALEAVPPEAMFAANFIAPNVRLPVPRVPNPIKAYHGSPHDFDKFDLSKIGTGEGAQAYGHGLYFSEKEGVARSYRDSLSSSNWKTGGPREFKGVPWSEVDPAIQKKIDHNFRGYLSIDDALASQRDAVARAQAGEFPNIKGGERKPAPWLQEEVDRLAWMEDVAANLKMHEGKMYEVALHAAPEQFLDWDKPLAGQNDAVRALLAHPAVKPRVEYYSRLISGAADKYDGRATYAALADWNTRHLRTPGHAKAAEALQEAGIPGIKYLDQGSRYTPQQIDPVKRQIAHWERILKEYDDPVLLASARENLSKEQAMLDRMTKQGTSNYVVFDDRIVDILKKYGIAGPVAASILSQYEGEPAAGN